MSSEDSEYRNRMDLAVECLSIELTKAGVFMPDGIGDDQIVEIATNKFNFLFHTIMQILTTDEAKIVFKTALKY